MKDVNKPVLPGYKQLVVHMDPSLIAEVKHRAISNSTTMKNWLIQAVLEKIERENQAQR